MRWVDRVKHWLARRNGSLAEGLPSIDGELDAWASALITGDFYLAEQRLVFEHHYSIEEAMLELLVTTLPTWVQRIERAGGA